MYTDSDGYGVGYTAWTTKQICPCRPSIVANATPHSWVTYTVARTNSVWQTICRTHYIDSNGDHIYNKISKVNIISEIFRKHDRYLLLLKFKNNNILYIFWQTSAFYCKQNKIYNMYKHTIVMETESMIRMWAEPLKMAMPAQELQH